MLIAGIGGGFAVYCGLPLATYLRQRGAQVSFANLSFTNLPACCCSQIDPNTWQITAAVYGLPPKSGHVGYIPTRPDPEKLRVADLGKFRRPAPTLLPFHGLARRLRR